LAIFDLETLKTEHEITRLLHEYCAGVDTGRLGDTARLFEKGSWFVTPEIALTGTKAVQDVFEANIILYDGVPRTRHVLTNIRIDLSDDRTTARAFSYLVVHQAMPGEMPAIIFQGAYDDTFRCTDGAWHFHERHLQTDGIGDMSKHLRLAPPPGSTSLVEGVDLSALAPQ
jgi:hypothetical protein